MNIVYVLMAFTALIIGIGTATTSNLIELQTNGSVAASADAIGIVAASAKAYQQVNPGASGNVPSPNLSVPPWFSPPMTSGAVFQGGMAYVYAVPSDAQTATRMVEELASRGFVAGLARAGTLQTANGLVVVSAPSTLPAGAVVIVQ